MELIAIKLNQTSSFSLPGQVESSTEAVPPKVFPTTNCCITVVRLTDNGIALAHSSLRGFVKNVAGFKIVQLLMSFAEQIALT